MVKIGKEYTCDVCAKTEFINDHSPHDSGWIEVKYYSANSKDKVGFYRHLCPGCSEVFRKYVNGMLSYNEDESAN